MTFEIYFKKFNKNFNIFKKQKNCFEDNLMKQLFII